MNTNFRELIGMPTLEEVLNVQSLKDLDERQRLAQKNIKYCANEAWQYVNGWYDSEDEQCKAYILDPQALFTDIKIDSKNNLYGLGSCMYGPTIQSTLKHIRFCGNEFLEKVTLYYVAKLVEEAFGEVEGTEEDATRIVNELNTLKDRVGC